MTLPIRATLHYGWGPDSGELTREVWVFAFTDGGAVVGPIEGGDLDLVEVYKLSVDPKANTTTLTVLPELSVE